MIDWDRVVTAAQKAQADAAEHRSAVGRAVQAHLDAVARGREYDGIASLCSYASDPNPAFAAEGAAGLAWRSAVWIKVAEIEADVIAEVRAPPSPAQVIDELPAMAWPE